MKLNAWFPTVQIGNDVSAIRDWTQAAEDLGYEYIEVPDHVFGATARDGWEPRYAATAPFHETFTTMAFMAACTSRIKLSSGVLILPQRQTGVVAKQAAEVDILSEGRLRLGIGVGWNHVEYEALGCDWKTRGVKQGEQIEALRKLWTEELVTYKGHFHDYFEVTVVPAPHQRPIPIWLGGSADGVIKRAARLGDGWMPILAPDDAGKAALEKLHGHLDEFGRKREDFGIEAWLRFTEDSPQAWAAAADGWRTLGADMAMLYPMWQIDGVKAQIEVLRRFKEVAEG
ncbi:MAG: LLM class F420-dependent oxidoreductase [Alphaproteobacteria bacterium]|jgi:probable F420-dependent oxidoreductase